MIYFNNVGTQKEFDVREGYAYKVDEDSKRKAIYERYQDIKDEIGKIIDFNISYMRGSNVYQILNLNDVKEAGFTLEDILIYCDEGNLCFGGAIQQNEFTVYTD